MKKQTNIVFDGTKALFVKRDLDGIQISVEKFAQHNFDTHKIIDLPPNQFRPKPFITLTFPKRDGMKVLLTQLMFYATDKEIIHAIFEREKQLRGEQDNIINLLLDIDHELYDKTKKCCAKGEADKIKIFEEIHYDIIKPLIEKYSEK